MTEAPYAGALKDIVREFMAGDCSRHELQREE